MMMATATVNNKNHGDNNFDDNKDIFDGDGDKRGGNKAHDNNDGGDNDKKRQ